MFKTVVKYIQAYKKGNKEKTAYLKELHWAHVYHDSIRGRTWLENQPLNIGRWAGNYAFFYLMNRILTDAKPKSILEFGLGESSKFISNFLKNELIESKHLVIENDKNWIEFFKYNYQINNQTEILQLDVINNSVRSFQTKGYKDLQTNVDSQYDLYVIDGPHGSKNYSRYDIVELVKNISNTHEFIIVVDDYDRAGEKETVNDILENLKAKNIVFDITVLKGVVDVALIVSKKYCFLKTV